MTNKENTITPADQALAAAEQSEIELRQGVDEIRKCSFRPQDHFIEIDFKGNGEKSYYLEVRWRLFWFHAYCKEHGIKRYSVEEEPATMLGTNLVQARAVVKMDGEIVGAGVGGYLLAGDYMYAVQQAETIAKGRALANAGFGTVFTAASAEEEGKGEIPCDAGMKTSEFFVRHPKNPMHLVPTGAANAGGHEPQSETAKPEANIEAPAAKTEMPAAKPTPTPTPATAMTRETALQWTFPSGKHTGKTMGELIAKDPQGMDYIKYCLDKGFFRKTDFAEAAKLVINF